MEDAGMIDRPDCPACGHPMAHHHGRHCADCERNGDQCAVLEPGVESPGGRL